MSGRSFKEVGKYKAWAWIAREIFLLAIQGLISSGQNGLPGF
jgi:hypothetical protein